MTKTRMFVDPRNGRAYVTESDDWHKREVELKRRRALELAQKEGLPVSIIAERLGLHETHVSKLLVAHGLRVEKRNSGELNWPPVP